MGKTIKFDLIGGYNTEESNAWNMQRSLNWYVAATQNGRNQTALLPTPGYSEYTNLSGYSFTGPFLKDAHSNIWTIARKENGVSGDFAYYFAKVGTPIEIYSNLSVGSSGNIITSGADLGYNFTQDALNLYMVAAASNISSGTQESFANIILTADKRDPSNTLRQINTPVGIRSSDVAYMDGWLIINHIPSWGNYSPNDTNLGMFITAVAQGNVTNIGSKYDFMYIQTDYVKRIIPNNGYLYLFGDNHYEVWYNTGNQDFPFEPVKEATQGIGLPRHWLITQHLDSIYFVGEIKNSALGVYELKGLELKKISTQAVDRKLQTLFPDLGPANNWRSCGMFIEIHDGNTFVSISLRNTPALVYNVTTGLWHEEQASGSIPVSFGDSVAYSTTQYIRSGLTSVDYGDLDTDTAFLFAANYNSSRSATGFTLERERISPHVAGEDGFIYHNRVRVDIQSPTKISNDSNIDANIWLYSSDDDGKTWFNHGMKSVNNRPYGNISGDKRIEWFRLGRSDDRVYKLWTNANIPLTITGAWLEAEPGYR